MLMTDWAKLCPRSHQHPQQFTGSSLIFNGVEQPEAPLMLHYIWQLADHFSNSFRDTFSGRTEDSELPFSLRRPGDSSSGGTNETVKQRSTNGFSFLLVWAKTNTVVKHRGGCVLQWHMLVVLRVFKCVCVWPGGLLLQLPERETAKTIKVRLAGDIKGNTKA